MGGPTSDWQCDSCGAVHTSNPEECSECGYTVLTPVRPNQQQAQQQSSYNPSFDDAEIPDVEELAADSGHTPETVGFPTSYIVAAAIVAATLAFIVLALP